MKYLDKSFTVSPGASDAYRDNWDRIFGKKNEKSDARERYVALAEELAALKTKKGDEKAEKLTEELDALWEQLSAEDRKGLKRAGKK